MTQSTPVGVEMTLQYALATRLSEKARDPRAAGSEDQAAELRVAAQELTARRLELARGEAATKRQGDARLRQDIQAGRPIALAVKKFKSRRRAATRRWREQPERAAKHLDHERAWHEAFDNPEDAAKAHGEFEDAY